MKKNKVLSVWVSFEGERPSRFMFKNESERRGFVRGLNRAIGSTDLEYISLDEYKTKYGFD